ncbi:hypothetical protein ACFYNL_11570 [Streptomyces sp. NPDC007808]|uniref:Imm32 family immunity protein n=1 Tax=Streptomyces sp. NPDC007808 TaxID=3364779 RepID=UPI0036C5CD34
MRLVSDPRFGEVDLAGSADELAGLADAVAEGEGFLACEPLPEGNGLTGISVRTTSEPGVRIELDSGLRALVISGDAESRGVLGRNLRTMAMAEDGGHLHVDYFPEHPYLLEGSLPLVVSGPHGGMPAR